MSNGHPELERILETAVKIARSKNHKYCLTEHMLLAMVRHEPFRGVLGKFGTAVDLLDSELDAYLNQVGIQSAGATPRKTVALERCFNRALTAVLFNGARRPVNTLDIYVAIMAENNSHAHYFLVKYGVRLEEFVEHWQKHYNKEVKVSKEEASEILAEHCTNLTELAREDRLEPMIGRQEELHEMITALARRFKANVLMVGDPGVGKCLDGSEVIRVAIDTSTLTPDQLEKLSIFAR
jgi:ATP-dependent Clp protease ATP-binding subunit ClpA